MSEEETKYYFAISWWILKLSIILILLIPGSMPIILGYIISIIYRFFDPELIVFNLFLTWYNGTIATWPLINQIVFYKIIVLSFVIPYFVFLRRRYPGLTWVEISKAEIGMQVKKLHKPEHPKVSPVK